MFQAAFTRGIGAQKSLLTVLTLMRCLCLEAFLFCHSNYLPSWTLSLFLFIVLGQQINTEQQPQLPRLSQVTLI